MGRLTPARRSKCAIASRAVLTAARSVAHTPSIAVCNVSLGEAGPNRALIGLRQLQRRSTDPLTACLIE